MEPLTKILAEQPFLKDLKPEHGQFVAGCGSEAHFETGEYLLREGVDADNFYLIRQGKVALGTFVPGRGFTTIQTLNEGEIVGWSWLIPPHYWQFSALVIFPTQAIVLDGKRLRAQCEAFHDFGYELVKRLAAVIGQRLAATRRQLEV